MIIFCHHFTVTPTFFREETEIIEGEVVEIQIDRPATGTVSDILAMYVDNFLARLVQSNVHFMDFQHVKEQWTHN